MEPQNCVSRQQSALQSSFTFRLPEKLCFCLKNRYIKSIDVPLRDFFFVALRFSKYKINLLKIRKYMFLWPFENKKIHVSSTFTCQKNQYPKIKQNWDKRKSKNESAASPNHHSNQTSHKTRKIEKKKLAENHQPKIKLTTTLENKKEKNKQQTWSACVGKKHERLSREPIFRAGVEIVGLRDWCRARVPNIIHYPGYPLAQTEH